MPKKQTAQKNVGASKVAKGLLGSLDRRLVEPAGLIIRYSGWVLFFSILYMVGFEIFGEKERGGLYIWLGGYAGYLLFLEILRMYWSQAYDTVPFRTIRIFVNLIVISVLINIAPTKSYLLVLAYTVPIFAAIVYFADYTWAKAGVVALAILGLYAAGVYFAGETRLTLIQIVTLTLLLIVLSIGFEFFRRKVNLVPGRLTEFAKELHKTLDLQQLMEEILYKAIEITQAQRGLIIVINPRNKKYVGHYMQNFILRENHSIEDLASQCFVLGNGQPFDSPDLLTAFSNKSIYAQFFEFPPRSVLAEPLYNRAGQVIGVINVAHDDRNGFDKISKNLLKEFAFLVSNAIDNCFQHREIILREARSREVGEKFVSADSDDDVIKILIEEVRQQIPHAEQLILHQYSAEGEELFPICCLTPESTSKVFVWSAPRTAEFQSLLRFGYGIAGHALELRDTILVPDVDRHPWYVKNNNNHNTKSLLVAPLFDNADNELFGTVSLVSAKPSAFNLDDESILTHLTTQASLAIAKFRDFQGWKEQGGTLRKILEQIRTFDIDVSENTLCEQIAEAGASLLGFKVARIRILGKDDQLVTVAVTGVSDSMKAKLMNRNLPYSELKPLLRPEFKVETSYLIRHGTPGWKQLVDKYFYKPDQSMNKKSGWHAYDALISPLLDPAGDVIGILTWDVPLTGSEPNKQILESIGVFASAASWVIELSRTQKRLTDQQHRAQSFIDTISQELAKGRDLATMGELVVQVGAKFLSAEGCSLYLVRGNDIELTHSNYLANTDYISRHKPISSSPKSGLTAWVASTGETIYFNNEEYKKSDLWGGENEHLQYLPSKKCRSVLLAPVKDNDGKVIGVISLENKKTLTGSKDFDDDDKDRLVSLASEFARALDTIGLYEDIKEWERIGLADDLHDLINWYHSGVVMWVEALDEWLHRGDLDKINQLMPELRQHALTTVFELKTLHTNMLAKPLEAASLKQALHETMQSWTTRAMPKYKEKMQVELDCPENPVIPVGLRNTLVRIASLAFSNAVFHSGIIEDPRIKVVVKVEQNSDEIVLTVTDNGRGMDFEKVHEGYGMDRMHQLAEKMNNWDKVESKIRIETGINLGTKVILNLKLNNQKTLV